MTIDYRVGDVRDRLAEIPDGSVSGVFSSPPFMALRSYLPADHPDKHREIGSEPDPAAFLDTLLALTAEWGRVLAPWGSIAIELGDSFSGSGGAGGDYADDGWRAGQQKFGGSASRGRSSTWSDAEAYWLAGVIDTEGSIIIHRQERGDKSPSYRTDVCISMMDRQVCDRAAQITGVGNVNQDGRGVYSWHVSAQQARYVLTNIWPHLLIKQRQAKAAIELQRHIEEFRGRGKYAPLGHAEIAYRERIREYVSGLNARGEARGVYVPTWEPPMPPRIVHDVKRSLSWPRAKCLALVPQLYAVALAYGMNPLTGQPSPAGQWLVRNVIVWHRPNPAVGALGDKVRPSTSYIVVATRSPKRWFDLTAVRGDPSPNTHARTARGVESRPSSGKSADRDGNYDTLDTLHQTAGAPPLDCWFDEHDTWTITTQPSRLAHYAMWPPKLAERLVLMMCPREVCAVCNEPRRRIERHARTFTASERSSAGRSIAGQNGGLFGAEWSVERETLGWTDCGHGGQWKPGVVLDPFAGTFTTGLVAEYHGRDAIGIDLNPANAELVDARREEVRRALNPTHIRTIDGQLTLLDERGA